MSRRKNTFSKAIKHLKESPTNSTSGVYSAVPGTTTRTTTVPGPEGPDYSTIDWEIDGPLGRDTSGLFDSAGNHKFISPPGDNSYILGPMASMWYAWGNFSTLGYIRESDRKMVNMGSIVGKLSDWDQTVFQSYGQMTLEQAVWFYNTPKKDNSGNDPDNANYRAFYPGPPSNTPDIFGRYYCTITGTPLATLPGNITTTNAPLDLNPEAIFAAIMDRINKGKQLSKDEKEWLRSNGYNPDGTEMSPEERQEQFFRDNVPGYKNISDWADSLPWNDPNHNVGKWINDNKWWMEPLIGTLAGAIGAKGAYGRPYKISSSNVNAWKASTPVKGANGKYSNIQLHNSSGDLVGKKFINPKTGKWDTMMRPTNKSSLKDKLKWEVDQLQHTNKSFNKYETTGQNPSLKDLDPIRLAKIEQGSTFSKGADGKVHYGGGTVGADTGIAKIIGGLIGGLFGTAKSQTRKNQNNSYNSQGTFLTEKRKLSILNSLKKPVVIPETKQKSYKVRPGRRLKTNFQGMDKLVGDIKPQESFKKPQDMWSDGWQGYNARLSQDKKNVVLEKIGEGKQAWNHMLKYGAKMDAKNLEEFWGKNPDLYSYYSLNGKKYIPIRKEQVKGDYLVFLVDEVGKTSSMLQSELNEKLSEESDKEMFAEYNKTNESIPFLDDPLVKKIAKRLKTQIDYPDKPAVKGYPNEPPPKQIDGWHPDFGKRYKYDKLDPVSAIAMRNAPTGNQEIDDNVKKSSMKPKVAEGKKENWRDSISDN